MRELSQTASARAKRKWAAANPSYHKEWRANNPDKEKAYYKNNRSKIIERVSVWAKKNPDKVALNASNYGERRRTNILVWARSRVSMLRYKASKNSMAFSLSPEYLVSLIPLDGRCPALGIQLKFGNKRIAWDSASVDRIVPSNGYVEGNVCIISNRANSIKRDSIDPQELRNIADYMERSIK